MAPKKSAALVARDSGAATPPYGTEDFGPVAIKNLLVLGSWYPTEMFKLIIPAGVQANSPLPEMPDFLNRVDAEDRPVGIAVGHMRVPAGMYWEAFVLFHRALINREKGVATDQDFSTFVRIYLIAKYAVTGQDLNGLLGASEHENVIEVSPHRIQIPTRPGWETVAGMDNSNRWILFDMVSEDTTPVSKNMVTASLTAFAAEGGRMPGLNLRTVPAGEIVRFDRTEQEALHQVRPDGSMVHAATYPPTWNSEENNQQPGRVYTYGEIESEAPLRAGGLVTDAKTVIEYHTGIQGGQLIAPHEYDPNNRRQVVRSRAPGANPGRLFTEHPRSQYQDNTFILQWDPSQNGLSCLVTPAVEGPCYAQTPHPLWEVITSVPSIQRRMGTSCPISLATRMRTWWEHH